MYDNKNNDTIMTMGLCDMNDKAVRVRPHLSSPDVQAQESEDDPELEIDYDPHVFDIEEIAFASRKHRKQSNNTISTTRFTWWNFVPLLLWINFTVNYYNWITLWVGFFQYQILGKIMYLQLLAFCIFLLSLQLIVEDIKRGRTDKKMNTR